MCQHCHTNMSHFDWAGYAAAAPAGMDVRAFHDSWLFPHGRIGYGPTCEQIDAAKRRCPFCTPLAEEAVA